MPPKRRSKTPNVKPILSLSRTEVSIKWSTENIERLLHLIDSKDKYRLAFFPRGLVKHKVCDVARELCIELQEDDPRYMEMLERRKQVVRKGGKWIPTKTWTSSYNNPVVTKYHDFKKRYADATVAHTVRPKWTSFKDVPEPLRQDFQKSCPWYFMFKKLDSGLQSTSPNTRTPRGLSTSERNTAARGEDVMEPSADTSPADPPAKVVNPFLNLRPMPKRPASLASPPPMTPFLLPEVAGHSKQIPIEIDSDSDSSSIVEIVEIPMSKPKNGTRKTTPYIQGTHPAGPRMRFRNTSDADKIDLKRLKRQMGIATRPHSKPQATEPKVFEHIPAERDRYMDADTECRNQIIRRARTHLLFRVLRDLESFMLPQCLDDCGVFVDPMLQNNHSARADQMRRIVLSAGGKVFSSEKRLSDTERAVRIYLRDDGPETDRMTRPMDAGDANQALEHRVYDILEFGQFLRRRIFHNKI